MMESGCPGALTCFYDDLVEVSFAILGDEHFFDIDSQPVVDLRHKTGEQAEHVEQIGAWEVIHDELYFVNREGTLIRFNAFVVKDAEDAYIILDDEMKARREKQGLKRPESWEYTCFDPDEEAEEKEGSYDFHNIKQYGICFPCTTDEDIVCNNNTPAP